MIALDLPGHGGSDVPPDNEDLSFMSQVQRVKQVEILTIYLVYG